MNLYNQIRHLTQDTIWKSSKNTRKYHLQKSQDVSIFLAGDHNAAKNGQDRHETQITKLIHKRSTALEHSVKNLLEGLNMFDGANRNLISEVDKANRSLVCMKDPLHTRTGTSSPCKYKSRFRKVMKIGTQHDIQCTTEYWSENNPTVKPWWPDHRHNFRS